MFERPERGERAILVRIGLGQPPDAEELGEFSALARSAGAIPVATITGNRKTPEPRYFIGSGKAEEIRDRAKAESADLVLVDHELSPSQERNLEKLVGQRVLDRTGLILDIFAQRARSAEGKLEVELAQLRHLSTRLVRGWTHLERQKGGIGLRGPGETQLETDRRLIGKRIRTLDREAREARAAPRHRPPGAQARAGAGRCADRLHERGQVDAVQRADRRGRLRRGPALRDARSDRAPAAICRIRRISSSPIPSASCATCRTSWWRHSARP